MDDFDFLEELDDEDDEFILSDDLPLDDEFIRTHFNTCDDSVIENFPFIEDDIDAITDYELFSKGFGYLDDKKADKEELSKYAKKDEIPDVSNYVTKDTSELENYPLTSSLSTVAFSGDYDDLSDKPTIPDVSNFITKDVNDLTYYTKSSDLSTVATTGDYDDLLDKPTIPDVSNFITKDVNDLTYYTKSSDLSTVATTGDYDDLSNKPTIPDVSNLVSNTDYATNLVGGVVKVTSYRADEVNSNGVLQAQVINYNNYSTLDNQAFIGKGTLENVITGKGLIDNTVNNLVNYMLSSDITTMLNGQRKSNIDADTLKTTGMYYLTTGCTNVPSNYFYMLVFGMGGSDPTLQIGVSIGGTTPHLSFRRFDGDNWSSWIQII